MSEWFMQIINYIGNKLWFNYSYWASDMFEHRMLDTLKRHRNEFLIDVFSTLCVSVVLALVVTTVYAIIYKNKYNQKASKSSMLELAFFVGFVNFFKWEIIALLPLLLIAWCITYLKVQENIIVVNNIKKKLPFIYAVFSLYLLFYVSGKVFNA